MRLSNYFLTVGIACLTVCTLNAQQTTQIGSFQTDNNEKQEFALSVGELSGTNPNASTPLQPNALTLDAGVAVELNYAKKTKELGFASVYWELNGLAGPVRYLTGTPINATHRVISAFVTPGVKLQFAPKEVFSPYLVLGAGYAFYDSSKQSIGAGTIAGGTANTYAVDFGAGVDYAMNKRYVLRGEVRGFYTGNPNFGVPVSGGQFNFVISGGIVWRK